MAVAIAAIACEPEVVPEVKVTTATDALTVPTEGNEGTPLEIAFQTNVDWTATVDAASQEWCNVSPAKGTWGTASIKFTALANETTENRVATITIQALTAKAEIKVTQLQKDAILLNGEETFEVAADGGQITVKLSHNVPLTTVKMDNWITQATSKAMQETEMIFDVAPNTGEAREGKITFRYNSASSEVTVKQAAWAPVFEVTPAEDQWIALEGGSVSVAVNANIEYAVEVEENAWLTMTEQDGTYTFTAPANEAYDYRAVAVSVTPKDEAYADYAKIFYIFQSGRATKLWTKNPVADLEGFDASKKVRLAKYGDFILVGNTTKAYLLTPSDGYVSGVLTFPDGVEAASLCVDDAGNIVVATDCAYGETMGIYSIADPKNPQPELIRDWNTGNYYGTNVGNLRIKGNIKENAVMSAIVSEGAGGAVLMWKFENGESSTWYGVNPPYTVTTVTCGCAVPLGTKFEDGFLYAGYGGDYNLKYLANPVLDNYTDNAWVDSYVTGYSWMENVNSISTAEYNGKKYAAFLGSCHFNYDAADAILLDITDPAAATLVYKYAGDGDVARDESWANLNWTGLGTHSDILLIPTTDALLMVYIDSNYGAMSCIAVK